VAVWDPEEDSVEFFSISKSLMGQDVECARWWSVLPPNVLLTRDEAIRELYGPNRSSKTVVHFGKLPGAAEKANALTSYHSPTAPSVVQTASAYASAARETPEVHWEDAIPEDCEYLFIEFC
jgi:hypothetical protein